MFQVALTIVIAFYFAHRFLSGEKKGGPDVAREQLDFDHRRIFLSNEDFMPPADNPPNNIDNDNLDE